MIKPDEKEFMQKILIWDGRIPAESWGSLNKRHYFLLDKWANKGLWNYGITLRSGWLETDGFIEFLKVTTEKKEERYFEN